MLTSRLGSRELSWHWGPARSTPRWPGSSGMAPGAMSITWYSARRTALETPQCCTMASVMTVPRTSITAAGETTSMMQEQSLLANGPTLLGNLMALTKWSTSTESRPPAEAGSTMAGHALPVIIGGHGRDAADPAGQSFQRGN